MMRSASQIVMLVLAATLLFGTCGLAGEILISLSPDRSGALPLAGEEVFGEVYIYFTTAVPEAEVKDVEFFIDGTSESKDNRMPYDLAGGSDEATPFDTARKLDDGTHLMEVVLNPKQGDPQVMAAEFFVNNAGAPLDPGTDLQVTRALADLETGVLTLSGHHFDAGVDPQVALELTPLTVTAFTSESLTAQLPEDLMPGDYLLNVSTDGSLVAGLSDKDHVEMTLTVFSRNHADLVNVGTSSHEELEVLISTLQGALAGLEGTVEAQQQTIGALTADLQSALAEISNLHSHLALVEGSVTANSADLATAQTEIDAWQASAIFALEPYVSVEPGPVQGVTGPHVVFEGANLHLRSGSGETYSGGGGLGNLILGYNEPSDIPDALEKRTGSHNLVVGSGHRFTSHGGLIGGHENYVAAWGGSTTGGSQNTAFGPVASVTGGDANTAAGIWSVVSGGRSVTASAADQWAAASVTSDLQAAESSITTLQGDLGVVEGVVSSNSVAIADLQASAIFDLEPYVSVDHSTLGGLVGSHILFEGVNVHIRSGSGATDDGGGALSGWGNLIIGYNEEHPDHPGEGRTGSHNLIVGPEHRYTSYGGLVAGATNVVGAPSASVSGGASNTASGVHASVSGGSSNQATGVASSVTGGALNKAANFYATVSGGSSNTVTGTYSSISGGGHNLVAGRGCSISGGGYNTAGFDLGDDLVSIAGGWKNTARNDYSTVSGGALNVAEGAYSSISGGRSNAATGLASSVSGGNTREATSDDDWAAGSLYQDQ